MRLKNLLITIFLLTAPGLVFGGTIAGKASYTGTAPKPRAIDMSDDPNCVQHKGSKASDESVVTGGDHGLGNVVVYVSVGAPEEGQIPGPAVTFEQKGCRYVPHVVVLHTGQEVTVVNHDQTLHNVHPAARANRQWNKSQPQGAPPIAEKFDNPEFIAVKCNVHPWMRGYFAVIKTSHYDLTSKDGEFRLPDLLPGKYTITAWHEDYGTQAVDVTISANETKQLNFTFKAKP
jgi:plastocyanin